MDNSLAFSIDTPRSTKGKKTSILMDSPPRRGSKKSSFVSQDSNASSMILSKTGFMKNLAQAAN